MRVPATGGSAVRGDARHRAGGGDLRVPQFLPDGRHILFHHLTPGAAGPGLDRSLDGGEPTHRAVNIGCRLCAAGISVARFPRSPHRTAIRSRAAPLSPVTQSPIAQAVVENNGGFRSAFSVSPAGTVAHRGGVAGGVRQLLWADRTGKTLGTLGPPDDAAPTSFALPTDGQHMANARTSKITTISGSPTSRARLRRASLSIPLPSTRRSGRLMARRLCFGRSIARTSECRICS